MKRKKIIESIVSDIKIIAIKSKKLPYFLGLHAFLFFIILSLIDLSIGGFLFYKYVYEMQKSEPSNNLKQVIFNEKNYQIILGEWQKRENAFKGSPQENFKSPF